VKKVVEFASEPGYFTASNVSWNGECNYVCVCC